MSPKDKGREWGEEIGEGERALVVKPLGNEMVSCCSVQGLAAPTAKICEERVGAPFWIIAGERVWKSGLFK